MTGSPAPPSPSAGRLASAHRLCRSLSSGRPPQGCGWGRESQGWSPSSHFCQRLAGAIRLRPIQAWDGSSLPCQARRLLGLCLLPQPCILVHLQARIRVQSARMQILASSFSACCGSFWGSKRGPVGLKEGYGQGGGERSAQQPGSDQHQAWERVCPPTRSLSPRQPAAGAPAACRPCPALAAAHGCSWGSGCGTGGCGAERGM